MFLFAVIFYQKRIFQNDFQATKFCGAPEDGSRLKSSVPYGMLDTFQVCYV